MNLLKNIVLFFLSIQEKMLFRNLNKSSGMKQKMHFVNGCYLSLDSINENEIQRMEEEMELILKSCNYNPVEIIEYIEKHNVGVYNLSMNLLKVINLKTGFIYPQKGLKALYLSLITKRKLKLTTDAMFVIDKDKIDKNLFMYHFYNWYTYRQGIQGINSDSQRLLNKYLNDTDSQLEKLKLDEMVQLKDAINQDKRALDFVLKLIAKMDCAANLTKK